MIVLYFKEIFAKSRLAGDSGQTAGLAVRPVRLVIPFTRLTAGQRSDGIVFDNFLKMKLV